MTFYFGLSASSFKETALNLLQSWLEGASGDLELAIRDVRGSLSSPMHADILDGEKFYHVLVVVALVMSTDPTQDACVTLSDEDSHPIVFERPEQYRQYLLKVGAVTEERYQEAWDIFVQLGVMQPKLNLDSIAKSLPPADVEDFCI